MQNKKIMISNKERYKHISEEFMENYRLVLPEHLNHYGYLFGGNLLKWVDEFAYIAAIDQYPAHRFVTLALDDVIFKKSIQQGTILRFNIKRKKLGNTSVQYHVMVFSENIESGDEMPVFTTNVTFVNVDESGKNKAICRK